MGSIVEAVYLQEIACPVFCSRGKDLYIISVSQHTKDPGTFVSIVFNLPINLNKKSERNLHQLFIF